MVSDRAIIVYAATFSRAQLELAGRAALPSAIAKWAERCTSRYAQSRWW